MKSQNRIIALALFLLCSCSKPAIQNPTGNWFTMVTVKYDEKFKYLTTDSLAWTTIYGNDLKRISGLKPMMYHICADSVYVFQYYVIGK